MAETGVVGEKGMEGVEAEVSLAGQDEGETSVKLVQLGLLKLLLPMVCPHDVSVSSGNSNPN